MPIPTYNALPLAKTWLLVRALTLLSMIIVVGLTSNFVSEIIKSNVDPPSEIVGTLVITCIATLYTLLSIPLFFSRANLGLLIMCACDSALLLSFLIVAVVVGKPLSFLDCGVLGDASAAAEAVGASSLAQALGKNLNREGSKLGFGDWVDVTGTVCYETKAVWGLCIALCILFFTSAGLLPVLWLKARRGAGAGKEAV